MDRNRLLGHPVRATILSHAQSNPGILLADLRRLVECSAGTIQYHVGLLEQAGMLDSEQREQRRHIFHASTRRDKRPAYSVLARRQYARDLLALISGRPGLTSKEITDRISISRKTLRDHVTDMAACGLLDVQVAGGRREHRATPQAFQLLSDALPAPAVAAEATQNPGVNCKSRAAPLRPQLVA